MAERIATSLKANLTPVEKEYVERKPTQNMTAYDYYLRGRESIHQYGKENNERAIEFYKKAIDLDPNFAAAYAGLAGAYAARPIYGYPETWYDSAIEMGNKAISIDPNLSEGYAALGYVYHFKGWHRKAIAALKKALELNPNYARAAGVLGKVYWTMGRLEDALPLMLKYAELDPTSAIACRYVGSVYDSLGNSLKAKQWYEKSIALDPAYLEGYVYLGYLNLNEGNVPEARRISQKALSISPDSPGVLELTTDLELYEGNYETARKYCEKMPEGWANVQLGFILWKEGKHNEAKKLLDKELQYNRNLLGSYEGPGAPVGIAMVYAIYGNKTEAIKWLKEAVDAGWLGGTYHLMKSPYFENLRDDPQFQELAAQIHAKVEEMRRRIEGK